MLKKKSISAVDDDNSVLLGLKAILDAEGHSVATAETGNTGSLRLEVSLRGDCDSYTSVLSVL